MASIQLSRHLLVVLLHAVFLLSASVKSDDEEDHLLQGLNSFRQSLRLPALLKNDKAGCLTGEIANQLEDQPCIRTGGPSVSTATQPQFSSYPNALRKCNVDTNNTAGAVILPVCVPHLVPTLVLTNYTHSPYAGYINSSRYTVVGLGHEDDWMVAVLGTNAPGGDFAGCACFGALAASLSFYLVVGMYLVL